ncbi:MAG: ArgE/DapE family deacylase [Actinobacteria bacterium]|nr:ArgE/DapE family deacylase [Actinomycetota bacterium]
MSTIEKKLLLDKINSNRLFQDLSEMIKIPSISGYEEKMVDFFSKRLREFGLTAKYQTVEGERKNIYVIHHFSKDGPLLTFNGHLDTVPPAKDWEVDPYQPLQKEGKLYGLGSCDMKGGLAALLEAFRIIVKFGKNLRGAIAFSGVCGEEAYSEGARKLLSSELADSKAIIIGEPWFGDRKHPICLGSTGKILYEITAKGKSAHGMQPEKGINAIEEMAKLLTSLDKLKNHKHHLFKQTNPCTLKIEGGYKEYSVVVPEFCQTIISRLIVPGENAGSSLKDLEDLIKSLSLKAKFEVLLKPPYYDPFILDKDEIILKIFKESYQEILKTDPIFGCQEMITDANIFTGLSGIPTLVFGPQGENLHSSNEYVEMDSLIKATKIYILTAVKYLSWQSKKILSV